MSTTILVTLKQCGISPMDILLILYLLQSYPWMLADSAAAAGARIGVRPANRRAIFNPQSEKF
jgi:hypothetical protein